MRILVVFAVALVFVVDANASRRPTPRERGDIVLALTRHVQRHNPLVIVRLDRIVVSTVQPGPSTGFTRFAVAGGLGRMALLGYYASSKAWFVQTYGSQGAVCRTHPSRFGGRRAAILRDLGLSCP